MPKENQHIQLPFLTSHAFLIGINDYEEVSPLSTAINDANAIAEQLENFHGYQVHGPLLNSTKKDILKLLHEDLPELVNEDDRMLFYFAGHGIALDSDDDPKGYLVPVDAIPGDTSTLVSMDVLHKAITSLPCKHGILIMDCCFAGAFKWSTGFRDVVFDLPGIIYEERFYQYAQDPAWQVITSSASDQKAVDILSNRSLGLRNEEGAKHSPFALALLEGLAGEADTVPKDRSDGVITATELYTYLRNRVEDETMDHGKRQSPAMFNLQRHDKGQYIFLHPNHRLNLPPIPKRNPFMGLRSYNEADTSLFYGRDRVIATLDELSQHQQLVVVSGASGTGKSSVIKAGLLPLLRKKEWQILPVVRPGKEPMQNLQTELGNLEEKINRDTSALLIIDQYEELITQCLHPEERVEFEEQMAKWITAYPQLRIVISIRSDFEPQFEEATLKEYWQKGRYVVPVFSQNELREVIIKPTIQEVLFFEPESLVDKLVDAVNQAPGALPLLSFTLSELYHTYIESGRTNRAFTEGDYEKLGGVIGALRTRANNIYDGLDDAHQDSMRKLMIRMVSLEGGELASRRVLSDDIVFSDEAETRRIRAVAQQLVEARLVSSGRDKQGNTYYEPAHDALVRAWARLWEWIKAMGEGKMGLMYKLSLAVADHQEHMDSRKAKDYLWNEDPRLDLLYADLQTGDHSYNEPEESFLLASYQLKKRNQRQRWGIVAVVMIGLIGLAFYAFIQQKIANTKATEALDATIEAKIQTQIARDSTVAAQKQRKRALAATEEAKIQTQIAQDSATSAQEQRTFADQKALEAQDSAIAAEQARDLAAGNLDLANKIIESFYFYEDRYGLAFKHNKYYYIDKKGNEIEKLGKWDKAEPFDIKRGIAQVTSERHDTVMTFDPNTFEEVIQLVRLGREYDEQIFIDTDGNRYLISNDLNNINKRTKALDLDNRKIEFLPDTIYDFKGIEILLFSENNLRSLSPKVGQFKNLTLLDLSYNQLSTLPAEIGQLGKLTYLDLRGNELKTLPAEIGQMGHLTYINYDTYKEVQLEENLSSLDLSYNQLSDLPTEIFRHGNLSRLYLRENQLTTLPAGIDSLESLTTLDLSKNRLTTLPEGIGGLERLTTLDLSKNRLTTLPEGIGGLERLTTLDLRVNQLTTLPEGIGGLKSLTTLDLVGNQLTTLPEGIGGLKSLTTLDLRANQLTTLPEGIGGLESLRKLELLGNKFSEEEKARIRKLVPESCDVKFNW